MAERVIMYSRFVQATNLLSSKGWRYTSSCNAFGQSQSTPDECVTSSAKEQSVTATEGDLQMIKINFASPRWIESEKPGSDCQKNCNVIARKVLREDTRSYLAAPGRRHGQRHDGLGAARRVCLRVNKKTSVWTSRCTSPGIAFSTWSTSCCTTRLSVRAVRARAGESRICSSPAAATTWTLSRACCFSLLDN
ncbi:unnamed protein product, partial [Trichogramma brassicae]